MITGRELEAYMIDRIGESWTEMPVPGVSVEDLEPESIIQFRNLGIDSGRITIEEGSMSREDLMDKLGLMKDGMLNRAAILLFHPNPGRILGPVSLKIGMFDGSDLLYQDEFSGPLIFLPNRVVGTLVIKYMYRPIGYEGITRTEAWPYSLPAIREAVLNAIVHNDYSSHVPIQIKVETDSLTIYNEGNLPNGWTVDKLMGQHKSLPRNPSLATVFYRTGSIEAFGRGIGKIMAQYEDRPGFRPVFESGAGFSVTFRNEAPFHMVASGRDASAERGSVSDYLGANGSGTYEEIADGTGLSIRQVQRLAKKLSDSGLVVKEKKGRRTVLRLADKTE